MPCVDGVEVLKKLRQEKTEIKIIVMSAIDINRLVNHVMGLKFDRYFVKPFDFHDLFVAIKEVTGT
jgi:DNA-binding NarL/FixJ family response regulator